jgi:predicted negative regulator of RcsB-dependent stress response
VDENLTDAQQADMVRRWLRLNGPFMVAGVILGLGALIGWNEFKDYREDQKKQASAVFGELMTAVGESRHDDAVRFIDDLVENYSGSPYLDQARLAMAKLQMDRNESESAAAYLEQVVSGSANNELRTIARLRLARVKVQQQQYDQALAALEEVNPNSSFAARYNEVRGDVYYEMGRIEDARAEYEAALRAEQPGVVERAYVQAKLDSLPAVDLTAQTPAESASEIATSQPDPTE